MIVHCQVCKEMVGGPDAPQTLLLSEDRKQFEFTALYQPMLQHIQQRHAELVPIIVSLVDQYALTMVSNVFGSYDQDSYRALQENVRASVWATLNQRWQFGPAPASAPPPLLS